MKMECGAPLRSSEAIEDEDARFAYEVMWGNHAHDGSGRCDLKPLGVLRTTNASLEDTK